MKKYYRTIDDQLIILKDINAMYVSSGKKFVKTWPFLGYYEEYKTYTVRCDGYYDEIPKEDYYKILEILSEETTTR